MPRLRCLMIVSSTVITALSALPASAATASPVPLMARAGVAVSPLVGGSNDFFNSDSCPSSTFCMAVGDYNLNGLTRGLSEKLSQGRWVTESVPSPARGVNMFANEVSCASSASCLFVGDHFAGQRGPVANLAEAWNGSSWRIVTTTGPAGAAFSALFDVACPTTKFCLAVGFAGPASTSQDAAYTWKDGITWRQIKVPHPRRARSSELGGLACFNAQNCMAVGNYTSATGRDLPFAVRWQHTGQHPQHRQHAQELLLLPRVRRGLERQQMAGIDVPPAAVALHRRLVPVA